LSILLFSTKCKIKNLIITKGSKGALLYNKEIKRGKIFPTRKVDVYDVAGAGDTFMASLVCTYLKTNDFFL
jgi:sugar/nucleoside kinase (ribokinase family)